MPIGRPLSPVSVAGVARRNDRHDGPGDNNHTAAKVAVVAGAGPSPVAKAAVLTSNAGPAVKVAAVRR